MKRSVRVIWLRPHNLARCRTLSLAKNEVLIVQTPPQFVDEVARALHGDPRVLAVVPDDLAVQPYMGVFPISAAELYADKPIRSVHNPKMSRPDLEDAYTAYIYQSELLRSEAHIDVKLPKTSYKLTPKRDISSFENRHKAERIFVLGNGPSLADVDPALLRSATTIGSNAIYLMFEKWGFPVTYWMCEDRLQIEQELDRHRAALKGRATPFLPFEYSATVDWPEAYYYPLSTSDGHVFPDGVSFPDFAPRGRAFRHGYTVTTSAIHLAAFMGASEIVLLGVDHNYKLEGERAQKWGDDHAKAPTHFDETYTAGKQFIRPRPLRAEQAYQAARAWCEAHSVRIVNASQKSALDVFERVIL